MFERFTQEARAAVVLAQREARALDHGWIGTEHLLLGLVADPTTPVSRALAPLGVTHDAVLADVLATLGRGVSGRPVRRASEDDAAALRDIGIDIEAVRRKAEERFGPGALDQPACGQSRRWWRRRRSQPADRAGAPKGHIPFTRRSKKALELALRESLARGDAEIGAPHLVLGLLRSEGLAATVLASLGAAPDEVRRVMLDQLRRAA